MRQLKENDPHRDQVVRALQEIEVYASDHGRVDGSELEALRRVIYDGKIDREKADYLVEIHKRVRYRTPAFENFFYQAIKDYILADGVIDAAETAWLRKLLFADGKIEDEERRFVHQLKGEAKEVSPEFEALDKEVMKQPMERHTAG
jgi:uncharacterized tellurite resistance protein B-like protein